MALSILTAKRSNCGRTLATITIAMKQVLCHARRARDGLFVQLAFSDAGFQGPRVAAADIVNKLEGHVGCTKHARRWTVDFFYDWMKRDRCLAKESRPPSRRWKPSSTQHSLTG